MLTPVPDLKSEITYEGGATQIRIVKPKAGALLFLPVWLIAWAFGERFGYGELSKLLAKHEWSFEIIFMAVWMTFWTWGGIMATFAVLFTVFGDEFVEVSPVELRLRKKLAAFDRVRRFPLNEVGDLQFVAERQRGKRREEAHLTVRHRGKDIRFASGIDEAEGKRLVTLLSPVIPAAMVTADGDLTLLKLS